MEFYRYEVRQDSDFNDFGDAPAPLFPHVRVQLKTFNLHRETPKGYWIGYGHTTEGSLRSTSRWVSRTAKKRYAFPTKEEALLSFFKRKKQQVRILGNQLRTAEIALRDAEGMLKNVKRI
jgi:hypothetical protein